MYYIIKFYDSWTLFDTSTNTRKVLQVGQIKAVKDLFSGLIRERALLDTVIVTSVPPNKLQQFADDVYVIFRFSENWSLYDGFAKKGVSMTPQQISAVTELFPAGLKIDSLFGALMASTIAANKVQSIMIEATALTLDGKATV